MASIARYLRASVIVLAALSTAACADGQSPAGGRQLLSVIQVVPEKSSHGRIIRKMLVFHGRRITGTVTFSYASGVAYINGNQWLPYPTQPKRSNDGYESLSDEDFVRFGDVPYIRERAPRNKTEMLPLVNAFFAKQQELGRAVLSTYMDNKGNGVEAAKEIARRRIDTTLAVADPTGPHAPRFEDTGVRMFFPGYGWDAFSVMPAGYSLGSSSITEEIARTRWQELVTALQDPTHSAVVVEGSSSYIIVGGEDADVALRQLDSLLSKSTDKSLGNAGTSGHGIPRDIFSSIERDVASARAVEQ